MKILRIACLGLAAFGFLAGGGATAEEVPQPASSEQELRQRLEALEKEMAEMRVILEPMRRRQEAVGRQKELQERARQRREAEKQAFSDEGLKEIEVLFKAATQQWNKPEGEAALATLTEKYPKADRTGAAHLQVAQMHRDEQGERLLRLVAEQYGEAVNAAGVKIGPLARFMLGMRLWNGGRKDEARGIFREIRERFPDAVGPRGNLLVDAIPEDRGETSGAEAGDQGKDKEEGGEAAPAAPVAPSADGGK